MSTDRYLSLIEESSIHVLYSFVSRFFLFEFDDTKASRVTLFVKVYMGVSDGAILAESLLELFLVNAEW